MTQVLERTDPQLQHDWIQDIFNKESHHNHAVIRDENGVFRWEGDRNIDSLTERMSLNNILEMFLRLGYDKNSEIYRELYRNMGVSLYLYWEVFYWEANNPDAEKYRPIDSPLDILDGFCNTQIDTMTKALKKPTEKTFRYSMDFAIQRLQEVKGIIRALKQIV
jgi:hypothetical protein